MANDRSLDHDHSVFQIRERAVLAHFDGYDRAREVDDVVRKGAKSIVESRGRMAAMSNGSQAARFPIQGRGDKPLSAAVHAECGETMSSRDGEPLYQVVSRLTDIAADDWDLLLGEVSDEAEPGNLAAAELDEAHKKTNDAYDTLPLQVQRATVTYSSGHTGLISPQKGVSSGADSSHWARTGRRRSRATSHQRPQSSLCAGHGCDNGLQHANYR